MALGQMVDAMPVPIGKRPGDPRVGDVSLGAEPSDGPVIVLVGLELMARREPSSASVSTRIGVLVVVEIDGHSADLLMIDPRTGRFSDATALSIDSVGSAARPRSPTGARAPRTR